IYDLDEGIYTAINDLFNLFCKTFDVSIKPREWPQIKIMVRTLTKIKKPMESAHLIPVQTGIIDLRPKDLLPFSPK
ncbi:DNA primase, partial [Streptococcus suis]